MKMQDARAGNRVTRAASLSSSSGGGTVKKKQTRFSREETRARILQAAAELFLRRDPDKVTVREIAERAGVTHPLVHQYVGSKADIIAAVVKPWTPHAQAMVSHDLDYRAVMSELLTDVLASELRSRAVVRAAMDGAEHIPLDGRFEMMRMFLDLRREAVFDTGVPLAPPGEPDLRFVLAASVALAFGWVAVESWLIPVFDLADESPEEVRAQLHRILDQLTELALSPTRQAEAGAP